MSRGRCFIGTASREFNQNYLGMSGLTREEIRMSNVRKCYSDLDDDRMEEVNIACANYHLRREIMEQKPDIIIPMGAVACNLAPDISLNLHHGLPMNGLSWYGHSCTTFPIQHPATSLHQVESMIGLSIDFKNLGLFIHGQLQVPYDKYPSPLYEDLLTEGDVRYVIDQYGQDIYQWLTIDTETDPDDGFYCLSFSMEHGTGFMVRRGNRGGIRLLHDWVMDTHGPVVMHNGMFDVPVLEEVEFTTPIHRLDDTMIRAYHLQWLPQALKELSFRLCGMVMEEFEDVVMPYSTDKRIEFILKLLTVDWPKPEEQMIIDTKTGEYKKYKPQGMNTKLKRLVTDFEKDPTHKIFGRWDKWTDEEKLPTLARFGDMPKPSIKYVPRQKQVRYACRDADSTGRVRSELIRLKRLLRKPI